ncbi:MAG: 1-acyl-sn-glycerol-3-phosphate acyltransferase [Leptolyngbyaceae cyanobacterium T60_A2020_046]|nr:1-acyl-sn-glycerol-3-phosphate acyltransferase [Leptolyngbyaceae cyanobacterium T60_A2020_046]
MTVAANRAQPPLEFLPPDFTPTVWWGVKTCLPWWMRWRSSVKTIQTSGTATLVKQFQAFQAGHTRFLIAFRHPSPEDAYCLANLLWHEMPKTARHMGVSLSMTPHVHFIYDRGIPLWAGQGVGWLYSKLGGTPIQRGKVDRQGLKSARHLFANGRFPLAAAPEGGNNGHTEIISPLEPGIAQFGFWCVEDLHKAKRDETVVILPLGIQYRYVSPPWAALDGLMSTLEQEAGLTAVPLGRFPLPHGGPEAQALYPRLVSLGGHLLSLMESYYADFYHAEIEPLPPGAIAHLSKAELTSRLQHLLDTALQVAESFFRLPQRGNVIDRCRRIEQAGWDWIYREELREQGNLSAVGRGLADRIAEEASLRMWHMRLVESFVAVTGRYVHERPTVERFAETLLLLRDTIVRIKGENPFPRPQLGPQIAQLRVGEPISVSDRWATYQSSRRQAVSDLTQDLQDALTALIPSLNGEN